VLVGEARTEVLVCLKSVLRLWAKEISHRVVKWNNK
jgi:hypothetical protein